MAKIISTSMAILTRIIFSAHSLLAVWQVTIFKKDILYWALCGPLLLLLLEGIFTIMIKKTQEWRWFCPSVFLYLASIVPAIWLLELDKIERRMQQIRDAAAASANATSYNAGNNNTFTISKNNSNTGNMAPVADLLNDAGIVLPPMSTDTWTTLIEQFLMLILIVGRWLLPKGDLTRDQLSQLLLVYIGTAADIIEFFDSYKDDKIASIDLLVKLTLGIWSWSLMQFTIVLSATRGRRPRGSGSNQKEEHTDCCQNCCCGIDVWGIVLNVILQDAPFLTFRLLIILQYELINYMNVFFTCKNSLVIVLQLYRLYVVNAEFWKNRRESRMAKSRQYQSRRRVHDTDQNSIYMISNERSGEVKKKIKKAKDKDYVEQAETAFSTRKKDKKDKKKRKRKDTGYSTASSQNLYSTKASGTDKDNRRKDKKGKKSKQNCTSSPSDCDLMNAKKQKRLKNAADKKDKKKSRKIEAVTEESSSSSSSSSSSDSSNSTLPSYEVIDEKKARRHKHGHGSGSSDSSSESSSSSSSSSSS
ncbi:transmembrane protein 26 [Drosophila tropicalis]|uniref:transmembrane protein 26 n=1 Tax=Drosophila tropicalis TaxID=46794 RepID=UPI0035ABF28C